MPSRSPSKHHRFPRDVILCAVRWYLRHPLSYQDVVDLMACASSDNLGHQSVLSFGGSGSSLIKFMRFQFRGASAA